MTKAKKIVLIVSVIALMVILSIISWAYGFRQGMNAAQIISSMAKLMLTNQHMEDQFENATCDGVKQSINEYLQAIENYKDTENGVITNTSYYGDLMIGHLRLAMIEELIGNNSEKEKHIALAREACVNRNWQDCSDETIMTFAQRVTEKYPIACLKDKK